MPAPDLRTDVVKIIVLEGWRAAEDTSRDQERLKRPHAISVLDSLVLKRLRLGRVR